jgi:hypothetical protein
MILKDVQYNTTDQNNATQSAPNAAQGGVAPTADTNYGTWNLQFSTEGTYSNFLSFVQDLEKNLRIVDISSIEFSSDTGTGGVGMSTSSPDTYTYTFKIETYWLKSN